ncbi:glycosyltransferase family protein [Myroides fluvii]|uniref:hypothetical protein n=1 Tax=Myroides fluvii TaxID=2572594 RepID=UPI00131AB2BA|nr:hypothetical protein [Myroides fluvii]
MKVVYLIYNGSNGLGGHFRSLKGLCVNWPIDFEYFIFQFGKVSSPVIESIEKSKFIKSTFLALYEIIYLSKYVKNNEITIIHCYDSISFFIGRIVSFFTGVKLLYTKCGGPNFAYTPKCNSTILFSLENFDYLQDNNKEKIDYYLIPNRIILPKCDDILLQKLKSEISYSKSKEYVFRIGNINSYYKDSIRAAFEVANSRNSENFKSVVVIIGKEYDDSLVKIINDFGNIEYYHLNDDDYTGEASKCLFVADIVLGTGRGAMEAIGLDKEVFLYSSVLKQVIKVSNENFMNCLYYNFSERYEHLELVGLNQENNLGDYYKEYCDAFIGNKKVLSLYEKVILSDKKNKFYLVDFLKNYYRYLKSNIPFKKQISKFLVWRK